MKSLHLAKDLKMTDFIGDIYGNLTSYYEGQKDYKNAYFCNAKYNSIYDSLSGEKKNKMIRQIQAKYQLNKNARELEMLKQKNQNQLRAINLAKSIQIYLFTITFLVIVFMIATFNLLVKERKLARALQAKTTELKDLNVSKDKFFSIIAHDLTNPFNVLVGFTSLLKTDLEMFSKEELQRILSDMNQASENGFNLLQDLMVWSQTQTDRIQINKSHFSLIEVYDEVKSLVELNLISKNQQLSAEIDVELSVFADRAMIATVLRNLIFNSVKFSPKGSSIQVKSTLVGNFAHVHVIDPGIGIAPDMIDSLFVIGKNKTGFGTEGESGTGLGLAICHEFVERNGGEIWVESKVGQGSVFSFSIPYKDSTQLN
jgi:signal transduction histidine kinase